MPANDPTADGPEFVPPVDLPGGMISPEQSAAEEQARQNATGGDLSGAGDLGAAVVDSYLSGRGPTAFGVGEHYGDFFGGRGFWVG
jgi:hypothetical protein